MPYFPGIAMFIDDQFNLVYEKEAEEHQKLIQQQTLKQLKEFCEKSCIPYTAVTETHDFDLVINKIRNYDNVRLLVLDLDLNNDGEVGAADDIPLILVILKEALKKYGYFFLLINSAHSEKWRDEILLQLNDELTVFGKPYSAIMVFDKNEGNIVDVLLELQSKNFSLELIYDFETTLNKARDKAFSGLIDFEKRTWNRIYKQLLNEASTQSSFLLSTAYLSIIRQHFLSARYTTPVNEDPIDESLAIRAFGQINYISNKDRHLNEQPVWTGNLYYIEQPILKNLHYAIIMTPECDIAQGKFINHQVVFGYEINQDTFPDNYNPVEYEQSDPPIHALKLGRKKNKWRAKDNLRDIGGFIEHVYTMPFASKNDKTVILDFRDLTFIGMEQIIRWELVKRVNDPMITDILDKLSLIFNRKGLLPLLPTNIKVI